MHGVVMDGVFLSDGKFVSSSFLPPVDVAELFRRSLLDTFVDEELITESVACNMLSWSIQAFTYIWARRLVRMREKS